VLSRPWRNATAPGMGQPGRAELTAQNPGPSTCLGMLGLAQDDRSQVRAGRPARQPVWRPALLFHQRVGDGEVFVEGRDAEIELFLRHDERRGDDEVADPGLNRNAPGHHLGGNLIDN